MEVAALGLKIEGVEGIDRAAASLDKLTTSADKAESAGDGLSAAFKGFASNQEKMIASLSSVDHHLSEISKGMGKVGSSAKDVDPASRAMQTLDAQVLGAVNSVNLLAVSAKESGSVSAAAFNSFASQQQKTTSAVEALSGSMRELSGVSAQAGASAKRFSEFMDSSVASQRSLDSALNKLSDTLEKLSESYRKIPKEIPAPKLPPVVVPPEVPKALTDLEKRAAAAGMSVGAMSAALRGVPAQFTDIAVSLQGGMSPLTVFLQQGGQLKDMFGGAGSAARALGGYVLGLVNPFAVAAAGAAALGLAYFQGSKEQDAFMVSMAKTGNAAGLTTSGLKAYAEQISATSGTQGKAAESLNIFIESGVKAGTGLARLTETAIAWEKATGEGVDKVAAKYVALQNDPLKAAMKLNEGMNFLTLSVYEQVKSLEEQGKTTDAAKVAMDALDSAMADRSKNIEANLGAIQKAWNGITGAAKFAWDAMLNVGRPASLNDQLSDVEKQLERLMGQQGFGETEGGAATGRVSGGQQAKIKESIRLLQEQKFALMDKADAETISALATQQNAEAIANKAGWDKIVAGNLSKQKKLELELANVIQWADKNKITGQPLEDQLAATREKYADKTKKSTSAVKAAKTAYESLIVSINEKIAATNSELGSGEKISEADKLRARYQQELTTRSRQFTEAQRKKIEADLDAYDALEKQLVAARALEKAWADDAKALEAYTKKQDDYLKTVTESVTKLEQEEEGHALAAQAGITHAQAMQQLAIARLEEARAQMLQGAGSADEVERINQEITARQKLLGLLGTAQAREANEKASKDALKEWEKTSELISDTLADYIMGGGKDAATYLKRLFATLVLQPVVKYGVQGALNSLGLGQGQGAASGGSAAGMPGGGLTDWSSWGTNASNWLSDQGISAIGNGWSDVGSGLHNLGQTIKGVDTFIKDLPGMSGGIGSAAGYLGAIYSLSQGKVGAAAGTAIGNYLLPGIGTMIGGMLGGLLDGLDDSGTKHMGAGAIYSAAGGLQTGAGIYNQATFGLGHPDEYSEAMQSGVSDLTKGLAQTLDAFSVAFGSTAGYSVAAAFADDSSKDGAWGSLKIADEVGKVLVDWGMDRESKFAPREFSDGEAGYKEYLNAVAVDVKNAFVAMDLPAWADQILATANDIDTLNTALQQISTIKTAFEGLGQSMTIFSDLSGEVQTKLLNASGGIESLVSSAGSFYQGFYTQGERATGQREKQISDLSGLGLYIDPGQGDDAKEMFRSTVEEAMASGQTELAAKLLLMSQSFSESATYWQQVLDDSAAETTRTIEKAQSDAKAVSAERYSLETTYLQLVGETDELRARELNTLDASNRELQKMIWARQDEAEEAAKAAQKMAETQKAIDSVTGSFSGLRETITLDQLGTDEAKYGYFKAQADSLTRMLPQLQDQEAITRAVNEIQSLTSRAYGSLDEAQKIEMGDEFLQYLAKTEDLALKSIERANKEQADATGKAVGDAVSKEVGRIVDAIASIASESGQLSRETVEAIRRLSTQTGNTVVGTGRVYAEVNS